VLIRKRIQKLIRKLLGINTNPFETYLIDEIEKLRRDNRPYFLIFHTSPYGETMSERNGNKQRDLWENLEVKSKEDEIEKNIRSNDYTYEEKDSWIVKQWGTKYNDRVRDGIKSLKIFYDAYKKRNWDKDTILIITADHGKIYSKGKVWYGYHNEEEVTKVPFLIHDDNLIGVDTRLGETIDITQTILEYFHIKERLSDKAICITGDNRKQFVTTITTYSKKREEQFLNVYKFRKKSIVKYVFNLKKEDYAMEAILDGYTTVVVDEGNSVFNNLDPEIKYALDDYGF